MAHVEIAWDTAHILGVNKWTRMRLFSGVNGTYTTLRHWGFIRKTMNHHGKPINGMWDLEQRGADWLDGTTMAPLTLTILDKEALPPLPEDRRVYVKDIVGDLTHPHPASYWWNREEHDPGPLQ